MYLYSLRPMAVAPRWLGIGMAMLLLAGAAQAARNTDRAQPINVRADRFEGAASGQTQVLAGNVVITQGSLEAKADRGEIEQKDGEVTRTVLTGAPARLVQTLDDGSRMNAQAQEIVYDLAASTVELKGAAVLERPQGTLRSERVLYRVDSGALVAGEGVSGGVQLVIPPKPPAAAKPEGG